MTASASQVRSRRCATRGLTRLTLRLSGAVLVAGLALFHAALLSRRIADLSLLDPLVGFKWLISAALIVALPGLRRAGVRLATPRRVAALAVLILLLHVPLPAALTAGTSVTETPAHELGWALLAIAPAAFGLAAIGTFRLLAGRSPVAAQSAAVASRLPDIQGPPRRDREPVHLFGRPPPVLRTI
jgi:hypothetical protein